MCGITPEQAEAWRAGRSTLPGPWAILMTRMLAIWVRNANTSSNQSAPDGDAAGLGASRLDGARNWLELAEETNKDFTEDDAREADRLAADRAAGQATGGNVA